MVLEKRPNDRLLLSTEEGRRTGESFAGKETPELSFMERVSGTTILGVDTGRKLVELEGEAGGEPRKLRVRQGKGGESFWKELSTSRRAH